MNYRAGISGPVVLYNSSKPKAFINWVVLDSMSR